MIKFLFLFLFLSPFAFANDELKFKSIYVEAKPNLEIDVSADPAAFAMSAVRQAILKRHKLQISELKSDYFEALKEKRRAAHSLSVTYTTQWASDNYLSILGSIYTYSGGAHGNSDFYSFFYDLKAKRDVLLSEIAPDLTKQSALRDKVFDFILHEIAKQKFENDDENKGKQPTKSDLLEIIKDDFILKDAKAEDIATFAFTLKGNDKNLPARTKATGLTLHFPHYAMGAYAEGIFTVDVPVKLFKEGVADKFKPFFE